MLCLFYYLRGPVVPVFRIYKDRISIIKWKHWSRFAHPETTARSRDATLAVCISGGPAAGGYFDFPLLWAHELLGLRALQHCCSRTLRRYRRLKLPLAAARAAATPCSRAAARRATTCRARYCVSASSRAKASTHQRTEKERGEEHQKIRNFDSKDLPQNSMDRDDFGHRFATSRINIFKNKFVKRLSIDHESKITQKYPRK